LDLVISVDSSVAHMAGALGKPVWVLLSHVADWRWMSEGETTPWYPTMRLFRQTRPDDWTGVIERVADALSSEKKFESRIPKFETNSNDQIAQNFKQTRFGFRI
jgi:ADP-heptose:LPS heptosyltransferase